MQLKGKGDETAVLARLVTERRLVTIPGGLTVTISGTIPLPPDTTIEGPGTIHLAFQAARLVLAERCLVRDVRFTCSPQFAHGNAIRAATTQPGTVRRMDCRIVGCTFAKMHGYALEAEEVSHVSFESNRWENHSDSSLYYNAVGLRAVQNCMIRGNTILHPNQGIVFHGGTHNIISDNYVENCLQGITCHTQAGHPAHWPFTLFTHNTIHGNVVRRFREEGICYDNSMGETPAVKAAQNQVRCVATVALVAASAGRVRVTLAEPANPNKSYRPGWSDNYYAGILTGDASATLLQVVDSGVEGGAGWIELPRTSTELHERLAKGDRLWLGAGCFLNTISANTLDNEGMVSGTGNATAIGLWGAAWNNRIIGNACSTRQYGITIGCVGLARPESPQGPCGGNQISQNAITATWANDNLKPRPEDKSAGIGFVYIGDGPLLGGRLFLANDISHNTISWAGPRPISLARDTGTTVAFNRITDARAAIHMDHTTGAVLDGNRTTSGVLITKTEQTGPCTLQVLPWENKEPSGR
jgi:parallel beta-helix repeat protein